MANHHGFVNGGVNGGRVRWQAFPWMVKSAVHQTALRLKART